MKQMHSSSQSTFHSCIYTKGIVSTSVIQENQAASILRAKHVSRKIVGIGDDLAHTQREFRLVGLGQESQIHHQIAQVVSALLALETYPLYALSSEVESQHVWPLALRTIIKGG
ncbi:hypothetical protein FGO68_gene4826 [Halteria grandinella]|uniref:Uncharacterized protein n=1 Tax=Halteria grandinella TaxID=5974 RepID=A0A8J8NB63_HALGN|nr:hypothetical protein FGO68_gene4826 [Halteria grandinella]